MFENVFAEILIHNALRFPSVIKTVNLLYRNISGDFNSWGIKFANVCENQVLWNISEFIIYYIYIDVAKNCLKLFIDFQDFYP